MVKADTTPPAATARVAFVPPSKPHFVQPLLPRFLHNFCIPKSFLTKYLKRRRDAAKVINLRTPRSGGHCWQIKVEGHNQPKFRQGWKEFVKHHDLQVGDFVVFEHQGNMVFDTLAFSPSGCERDYPPFEMNNDMKNTASEMVCLSDDSTSPVADHVKPSKRRKKNCDKIPSSNEVPTVFVPSSHPYCRTTIKSYCETWSGIYIPVDFVKSFMKQVVVRKDNQITLIDEKQRSWILTLRYKKDNPYQLAIGIGWRHFQKARCLKTGDPVVFELIETAPKIVMRFYKAR